MTTTPAPPTVLIVDSDLGLVSWLGEIFSQAGYRALPALECRQGVALTQELNLAVDVIVVNEGLPEISWMVGILSGLRPLLKIILIRNPEAKRAQNVTAHAMLERPSGGDTISRPEWLRKVLQILQPGQTQAV